MINLLLVEDNEKLRFALKSGLEATKEINVINDCDSGEKAFDHCLENIPDVIIMDEIMPDRNVLTMITSLRKAYQECVIILLSLYDDESIRIQAKLAGAAALISKRESVDVLLSAFQVCHLLRCRADRKVDHWIRRGQRKSDPAGNARPSGVNVRTCFSAAEIGKLQTD